MTHSPWLDLLSVWHRPFWHVNQWCMQYSTEVDWVPNRASVASEKKIDIGLYAEFYYLLTLNEVLFIIHTCRQARCGYIGYCLCVFVCVCVCTVKYFSAQDIKLIASNFARRLIGVQGRESPISVNFAPLEAQNRTNQTARGPRPPLTFGASAAKCCRRW